MPSSMEMERYMESELSCTFWVKLVTRIVILGFQIPGLRNMLPEHMVMQNLTVFAITE